MAHQAPGDDRERAHHARNEVTHERLVVEVHLRADDSTLARDVRKGLGARPYHLPPKHFYDDLGSRLFDAICNTPEYYLTRAEAALLERTAADIVAQAGARELVELGSGAARKTHALLGAMAAMFPAPRYLPFDVSEEMLRSSSLALLEAFPTLRVHGIVGDYERHLDALPPGKGRLVAFLGSSVGNFTPDEAVAFLSRLGRALAPGDHVLIGVDLVKDVAMLERAYNDAAGLTAAFNRNVLAVINRELGGDFNPLDFDHVAFFDPRTSQIEMYLRARRALEVHIEALGLRVPFARGEVLHTEISRKFTRDEFECTLRAAGMVPVRWEQSHDPAFGLALARVRSRSGS